MYVQKKTNNQMQRRGHKTDFALCVTVFLLLALGIVMVLSASAPSALAETGKSYTYFEKQLMFAGIGIVVMFIMSFFPYKKLLRYYKLIYVFSVLILLLVLVPSEITKIGLIVAFAGYFTEHRDKIGTFEYGFFRPMVAVGIPVVILFAVQSHLSAAILIFSVCSCIMIVAGTRIKYFAELN